MPKLSIVVATYNEEKNVSRCLESVKDIANEIILVDASSSDQTVKIAKGYNPKIFIIQNNKNFHKNKQYGLDKASGDWILQLDADEIVSQSLKQEIKKILEQRENKFNGFYVPRKNHFLGKWMRKGGLYPDSVIRLIRKGKGHFPCKSVHEQIEIIGSIGWLENPLIHYPYPTISEYLVKANRYTTLTAEDLNRNNAKISFLNTIKYCLIIPLKTFFNIYVRHQGFLDGLPGFIWAVLSSTHYFLAYAKLINIKRVK